MADHAPVMMWVTDRNGACTYLNRRWYEFTGQTVEQAEGLGWLAATHPDDKERTEREFLEANASQHAFRLEYRLRRADGTFRWAIDAAAPRFGDDGAFLGFVGSVIDIDERKDAEERLRLRSEEFQTLANNIPTLCWMADADGSIFWYNQRWYDYTGTSPEDQAGWGWESVHDPEMLPNVVTRWRRSIDTGEPFEMTFPLRGGDGVFRPFLTRVMPIRNETDQIVRWFGTNVDISAQREVEDDLRESEARFRAAVRAVEGVLWTNNARGEMEGEQHGWGALTGQTLEEYQGFGWAAAVHPEDAPATVTAWNEAVAQRKVFVHEHRVRRASDGSWRTFSIRAIPVFGDLGAVSEWVGVHTDITDRKGAEAALRESQERLSQAKDAAGFGIFDHNLITGSTSWDKTVRRFWGLDETQIVTRGVFLRGLHPDDREEARSLIDKAMNPEGAGEYRAEYRVLSNADGAMRWVEAVGKILFDGSRPVRFVGTVKDVSERKNAEQHRDMLVNELNHRVKNTLAMVQAIATQTFRGERSDPNARASFNARVQALALAHDVLTRENWDGATLRDVIEVAIAPHRRERIDPFILDGPDMRVQPQFALSMVMTMHELVTNAAKYGALSVEDGSVSLSWAIQSNRLVMNWQERGGPPVQAPTRTGFGSRLIESGLAQGIAGQVKLEFLPAGVTCVIDVPIPIS